MKKELVLPMSIHNRFDIEVIDTKTGKIRQTAQAFNVICNNFWDRCVKISTAQYQGNWNKGIVIGDGEGTPAETDTALFSKRGYKDYDTSWPNVIQQDYINGVIGVRKCMTLQPSEYPNTNITEVGMAEGTNTLLTHAMLQDMNGNPISIHKTDTDLINIYATVYMHWNPEDGINFQWDGSGDNCRAGLVHGFFGMIAGNDYWYSGFAALALIKCARAGNGVWSTNYPQGFVTGVTKSPSTSNERKKLHFAKVRYEVSECNGFGGFPYMLLFSGNDYQTSLIIDLSKFSDPSVITQEAVATGDGTTRKFGTVFDFPYEAEVFVNGQKRTSGVTVSRNAGKNWRRGGEYFDTLNWNSTLDHQVPQGWDQDWRSGTLQSYGDGNSSYLHVNAGSSYLLRNRGAGIATNKVKSENNTSNKISCSNDLEEWVTISENQNNVTTNVPVEYQHYKFWKIENGGALYFNYDGCNIEFTTPPADGDVITISYKTDVIAKDSDHVYDFAVSILFDSYNE